MDNLEELSEPKNVDPPIVTETISLVLGVFESYGWYIFFAFISLVYAYWKMHPMIDAYYKKKAEEQYAAKYHKNPDLMSARLQAMERARLRMQENYNDQLEEYKFKMEERKKKKQEELIEKYNNLPGGSGRALGGKASLRQDYNPLMGDGGSSYRAPKKKTCGGGGCGKQ